MTPERWRKITAVFDAALARDAEERPAFLSEACNGDAELRREVEALLASHERAGGFIEEPAVAVAARQGVGASLAGQSVAHYQVLSLLGAGGMGDVYLALDTKLGRRVALKLLPDYLAGDERRARRFTKEARAASALNHPNIITVYEIGDWAGRYYIAMEYVEGETLREKIHVERAPLGKLLDYLQQAAEGLAKAHAAGIVHRDLKPDNIMVTRDGYAKVLDFGLAKLVEQPKVHGAAGSSEAATALMSPQSLPGVVMGTVGYMSPEQAQGKTTEIDHRTDIFSLGCILFEAATGRKPFEGDSVIASLHKTVYEAAPSLQELNPEAPAELQRVVRRCLQKDPEERYQTIKDVAIELKELLRELAGETETRRSVAPPPQNPPQTSTITAPSVQATDSTAPRSTSSAEYIAGEIKRHKLSAAVALAALLLLAGFVFGLYKFFGRNRSAAEPAALLKVTPLTSETGVERSPAFSPDGRQVAYVWTGESNYNFDIYVKLIGAGAPLRLTTGPSRDMSPAFSPDGRYVAFQRGMRGDDARGFYLVPALGGAERKVADAYGWAGLGVQPQALDFSPDGRTLAVVDKTSDEEPWSISLISVETGERRRLTTPPAGYNGDILVAFSPDGSRVAFARTHDLTGDIYIVPVAGGEPARVTSDNATLFGLGWTPDGADLVFSSNRGGGGPAGSLWRVPATGGTPVAVAGVAGNVHEVSVSRQGDRLAYAQMTTDFNIYRVELTTQAGGRRGAGAPAAFISSTRQDGAAQFSPDGRRIVFTSNRSGSMEIWTCDSEGKNTAQLTNLGGPYVADPGWSPDGRFIAFDTNTGGNADIYVVSADGGSPRRLMDDPSGERMPSWSRDGRSIYFVSNRTGRDEVWRMPATGGTAVQFTRGGGTNPVEAPDGRSVYYLKTSNEAGLWQMGVEGGEETRALEASIGQYNWAVMARGIYFLRREPYPQTPYTLEFFDFATRQTTPITTLKGPRGIFIISSLSISPDEHSVIYTQRDQLDFDLMLVENFR